MMRHSCRTLGFLLLLGNTLYAQAGRPATPPAGNGEARGTVIDGKDTVPLNRASIAVRRKRDSSLVAGAITGANGAFRIPGLRPGVYTLRATALGFSPKMLDITVTDSVPVVSVGAIRLSRFAVALKGVEVTEDRAVVAIEPDRNSYQAKDVAPAAANASDVLEQVPSVAIDADGKVSLRGNENVVVQINGRPTPITGTQLGAYLKSLPASVLDRVEVVPNPSAKYDPEGMAGIINIGLKQNTDLGFSGGLNANVANSKRYGGSGNLGYQAGNLTTFTNYGYNADDRSVIGLNDRERIDALRAPLSYTEQDIATANGFGGHNLNANVDYKLTPRDVLSNALSFNRRMNSDATLSAYSELTGGRSLLDSYDRVRRSDGRGTMFDYNIALKRTLEPRKHELSGEVRFNRLDESDRTILGRQALASPAGQQVEREIDNTNALTKQLVAQTDYMRTLAARTKLETGAKSTTRWLDRDFSVNKDSLGTGAWVPSNLSNALSFRETVNAAYAVLSQGAGPLDLQAGLRAEQADRDFRLAGSGTSYPYRYASIFPSGVVLWNASDAYQAKISYSRRIRRPGTQELNPFPSFFDIQNVFIGNPSLSPEYTDALELGLTRTGQLGSLQLSPFYRHTTNIIRVKINTADHIGGREVTTITFNNLATSNSWGTDLNGSLRLGPRLSGFAGFNLFKMVTDGGSSSVVGSDAVTWSARLNATTQITPTLLLQANYFYRAPMKIEGGEFYAMQNVNFTVRKKLDGDNASIALRFVDPFNTGRFRVRVGDDNVIQLTERSFGVRGVFVVYQYTFGQVPRVRQPRPDENQGGSAPFP